MFWIFIVYSSIILQIGSCREESSLAFSARDGKGWGSGETSSKFFDIALTALAFLSFGIFLLNLLLNALLFPLNTTTLTNPDPILTMITGGGTTGGAIVTGRTHSGLRRRSKRAIFSPEIDHQTSAKYLISFVTNSIETMAQKHECVPRLFCDGNRRSRVMGSVFRVLFPLISVSISYLGKTLGLHDDFQQHIDAIVLGASEDNCEEKFPVKCE